MVWAWNIEKLLGTGSIYSHADRMCRVKGGQKIKFRGTIFTSCIITLHKLLVSS